MNERYIQINTIAEIDITKVRPADLKKRYIDPQGNRYAIKFDVKTRKVRIVQIIKGMGELHAVKDRLSKTEHLKTSSATASSDPDFSHVDLDMPHAEAEEPPTNEEKTLSRGEVSDFVSKNFVKTKDRLKATLNHLRKSTYFDRDPDPQSKNYVLDMARILDNDCIKRIEQSVSLIIELKKFPRPVGYYINKMDPKRKEMVEKLGTEDSKMELIKDWELQNSFLSTIEVNIKTMQKVLQKISEPKKSVYGQLSYSQKQSIRDAKLSADFAINELNKVKKKVLAWKTKSANQ